jgi:hypothetical protein
VASWCFVFFNFIWGAIMFRFILVLLIPFFSCTKNFTFATNSKVRKISRDVISDILFSRSGIGRASDVEQHLSQKLQPLFDKYPPSILENRESISSMILSDGRTFSTFSEKYIVESVFRCIVKDEKLFEREVSNFDDNKENFLHVVIENYGIDNFWTIVDFDNFNQKYELDDAAINVRKEILAKTLFFCNENTDSLLSLVLKEVNKAKN